MISATYNICIYPIPKTLPFYMLFYPPCAFARVMYILSINCSYSACISKFKFVPREAINCIIILYADAIIYLLLGMYLNEIVTQEFGTRKSPLFIFDYCLKPSKKKENSRNNLLLPNEEGDK